MSTLKRLARSRQEIRLANSLELSTRRIPNDSSVDNYRAVKADGIIEAENNKGHTMREEKRCVAAALIAGMLLASTAAFAQISDDVVKLGVTNDQASIYSAAGGFGGLVAT